MSHHRLACSRPSVTVPARKWVNDEQLSESFPSLSCNNFGERSVALWAKAFASDKIDRAISAPHRFRAGRNKGRFIMGRGGSAVPPVGTRCLRGRAHLLPARFAAGCERRQCVVRCAGSCADLSSGHAPSGPATRPLFPASLAEKASRRRDATPTCRRTKASTENRTARLVAEAGRHSCKRFRSQRG